LDHVSTWRRSVSPSFLARGCKSGARPTSVIDATAARLVAGDVRYRFVIDISTLAGD